MLDLVPYMYRTDGQAPLPDFDPLTLPVQLALFAQAARRLVVEIEQRPQEFKKRIRERSHVIQDEIYKALVSIWWYTFEVEPKFKNTDVKRLADCPAAQWCLKLLEVVNQRLEGARHPTFALLLSEVKDIMSKIEKKKNQNGTGRDYFVRLLSEAQSNLHRSAQE